MTELKFDDRPYRPGVCWYIGDYNNHQGDFMEYCWGITRTGYWSGSGYTHTFWGLALGTRTFGIGRITHHEEQV